MPAPKSKAYSVSCPSRFRDRVNALAKRRGVSIADLARAVLIMLPEEALFRIADPGEPGREDRENVLLKSGPGKGRWLRRKPRLQLRLEPGCDKRLIRLALALAVALDEGTLKVKVEPASGAEIPGDAAEDASRLRRMVETIAFLPLAGGIANREQALHVLGFPPGARPDPRQLKARFRALAHFLHPDNATGDHLRMSQLNAAIRLLTR